MSPTLPKTDRLYSMGEPQTYIGTKTLYAVPMTLGQYNNLREWQIPAGQNPDSPGYFVEYVDGEANMDGFAGYVSWSPRDVFEKNYRVATTFIDRLHIEQSDLKDKLEKIDAFIISTTFGTLNEIAQELMTEQRMHMFNYLNVLNLRIADFNS